MTLRACRQSRSEDRSLSCEAEEGNDAAGTMNRGIDRLDKVNDCWCALISFPDRRVSRLMLNSPRH